MAPLGEVRRHEALGELGLTALLFREMQQLVRLHGVGVLEQIEAVRQARVGRDPGTRSSISRA